MKIRNIFNVPAACLAVGVACSGAFAQTPSSMVEFEQLGQPLSMKKMGAKEKAALKQLGIDGDEPIGEIGSGVRVVSIAGGSGMYVIEQLCNVAASGSSEACELTTIASLATGKKMSMPGGGAFTSSFRDSTDSAGDSRYLKNEKGELQSLVYAGTYIKKIKGKKSCDSRGAILDFDAGSMKLVVRVSKKPLGNGCQQPDQLFSKALSD